VTEASRTQGSRQVVTSAAQDGVWLLDQLVPNAPASSTCRGYLVTGELDVEALRAAWRAVLGRHEVLRTTLVEVDGRPVQRIAADDASGSFVDLGHLPSPDPGTRAARMCAEGAGTAIDLADGPLARLTVARLDASEQDASELDASEHVVLLVLHRAVADEPSASIVADELSAHYAAAVDGRAGQDVLPVPRRQYADYARWQRDRAATPAHREQLDWWISALTPLPPPLTLPTDRVRPSGPSSGGGVLRFDWGADLAGAVHERSAAAGTTPSVVLLAGFQALLHRYTGEDRIAVVVPTTVRPGPDFDGLVGPFGNPLVLCADFSELPSFGELLGQVARLSRDAADRRELPFDTLVGALDVDRDPRRIPFCDAVFVVPDAPERDLRLSGAVVRRVPAGNRAVRADITLTVDQVRPSVAGSLEYRGSMMDPASAELVLDQLHRLLAAGLADPGTPVDALPLESADRVRAAVREADQVTGAAPAGRPVHELVHLRARQCPDADAVAWRGGAVSYRELTEQAASITAALRALGAVDGEAVAVRMAPGPRQAAALLGVLDAGAHLLCLGAGDVGERGQAVLADLRPACLVLDGGPDEDELTAWYRAELDGRVLDSRALDAAASDIAASDIAAVDLAAVDTDTAAPAEGPAPRSGAGSGLDRRAYVAYTSGSTGRPKGISQTHGGLAQFVGWFAGEFGIGPGSRVAQWAAPGYDASLCEAFAALVAGATLCPVPERIRAHPGKLADWLATERITLFQTVPSFARELLKVLTDRGPAASPDSLDHLLLAGETLSGELANGLRAALPSARLVNLYGPTESILATWHPLTADLRGPAPIGRSIPGRQVLVLDDSDRPCPTGVTGNLVIRSPYVTPRYVGASGAETAAFAPLADLEDVGISPGPCYRTGDLGRRRRDGALDFAGRRDFQVKLFGTRTELTDIEAALAAHRSVSECAVVALTDSGGLVTGLAVYVVPRTTAPGEPAATAKIWRAHLRRRFGQAMPPATFTVMGSLPRNTGGKVDRKSLPAPDASPAEDARAPLTPLEASMAALWSDLLGGGRVAADDSFFAAGGDSLLAARLRDQVRQRFHVQVPLWEYFANPTLAGISAVVRSALRSEDDDTVSPTSSRRSRIATRRGRPLPGDHVSPEPATR
jgi:(S)-beta-tyrosine adenylation enzyme